MSSSSSSSSESIGDPSSFFDDEGNVMPFRFEPELPTTTTTTATTTTATTTTTSADNRNVADKEQDDIFNPPEQVLHYVHIVKF